MKRRLVRLALLAIVAATAAAPAAAQRVRVGLTWRGDDGVRVSAQYRSHPRYARLQYRHCEQDGGYFYCWDERDYWNGRSVTIQVIPVYDAPRARAYRNGRWVARPAPRIGRRAYERHHRAALRAFNRWARYQQGVARGGRRVYRDRWGDRLAIALEFRF